MSELLPGVSILSVNQVKKGVVFSERVEVAEGERLRDRIKTLEVLILLWRRGRELTGDMRIMSSLRAR